MDKSKYSSFESIQEKVWARVNNWKHVFISQAGREILLKTIIQAILTYPINVFLLPITLCKEIASTMSKFWCGCKENDKKIYWQKWEKMGKAKGKCVMCFQDILTINKLCWQNRIGE